MKPSKSLFFYVINIILTFCHGLMVIINFAIEFLLTVTGQWRKSTNKENTDLAKTHNIKSFEAFDYKPVISN